jgi:hypothetical protein
MDLQAIVDSCLPQGPPIQKKICKKKRKKTLSCPPLGPPIQKQQETYLEAKEI